MPVPNSGPAPASVTIDGAGNVGIGTASPSQRLAVQGNVSLSDGTGTLFLSPTNAVPPTTPAIRITDTGDTGLAVSGNPLRLNHDAPAGSPVYLTNGAGNIVLTVGGNNNVGIGTTSPGYPLDVAGTIRMTGALLGSDQLMTGALKDSTGNRINVDAGGCYYAS